MMGGKKIKGDITAVDLLIHEAKHPELNITSFCY